MFLVEQWLNKECDRLCLPHQYYEVSAEENFHTIHASRETGEIIYVEMQMEPGFTGYRERMLLYDPKVQA